MEKNKSKRTRASWKKGFIFSALAIIAITALLAPMILNGNPQASGSHLLALQAREAVRALASARFQPISENNASVSYIIGPYLSDRAESPDFNMLLKISGKSSTYKAYFGPRFDFGNAGAYLSYEWLGNTARLSEVSGMLKNIEVRDCTGCRLSGPSSSPQSNFPGNSLSNYPGSPQPNSSSNSQSEITQPSAVQSEMAQSSIIFDVSANLETNTISVSPGDKYMFSQNGAGVLEISNKDGEIIVSGQKLGSTYFHFDLAQGTQIYAQKTITDNGAPAWIGN